MSPIWNRVSEDTIWLAAHHRTVTEGQLSKHLSRALADNKDFLSQESADSDILILKQAKTECAKLP